jgi:hypothetical protein
MLSEDVVRNWRDKERERVEAFVNPYHRRLERVCLDTLNTILEEE